MALWPCYSAPPPCACTPVEPGKQTLTFFPSWNGFDKCSMSIRIEHINGYIFTSWLWLLPVPTHIKYLISASLKFSSTFYQLWHLDVCLICVYFMPCFLGEEFFPSDFCLTVYFWWEIKICDCEGCQVFPWVRLGAMFVLFLIAAIKYPGKSSSWEDRLISLLVPGYRPTWQDGLISLPVPGYIPTWQGSHYSRHWVNLFPSLQ